MSNATVDQHPKGQVGRQKIHNGFEEKKPNERGDDFQANAYMHPSNVNQAYGIPPSSESYMPSYYGQMAFPYMGGPEWSSGNESYLPGYGADTHTQPQHSFMPDAMFGHPSATIGNSAAAFYNQAYNYFPAGSEFSAWASPGTGHGNAIPDNNANNAFGQQNTASPYNGDYYQMMPATPHDYLGGGEVLSSGDNSNLLRHPQAPPELPGVPGMPPVNPLIQTTDPTVGKMPVGTSANGIKLVEQGMQNMGLGVSALGAEQLKHPMQSNVAIGIPGGPASVQSVVSQNSVIPGSVVQGPPINPGSSSPHSGGGSNAPKPVSWAAIASKPAKPQPKPKVKVPGPGLPPPVKHNSEIGNWDEPQGGKGGAVARGSMPGQPNMPQRWSSPRQGGNNAGSDGFAYNSSNQGSGGSPGQQEGAGQPQQQAQQSNNNDDSLGNAVLQKLKSENDYNPKRLTLDVRNARFFVIKSYSEDDIHRSIKYNIWCSTEHGNKRLDSAFKSQQGKGPVILLYSVNGSGHFCGVAEMATAIDYSKKAGVWTQDKWKGKFQVKWIYAKDVPNSLLRHIRLENNENKPVTNSRDTQEVPADKGRQVLKIISTYKHQTSIFDDFAHYERRQVEEENMRKKRNDMKSSREKEKSSQ